MWFSLASSNILLGNICQARSQLSSPASCVFILGHKAKCLPLMGVFTVRNTPSEADAAVKTKVSDPLLLCEACCNRTGESLSS